MRGRYFERRGCVYSFNRLTVRRFFGHCADSVRIITCGVPGCGRHYLFARLTVFCAYSSYFLRPAREHSCSLPALTVMASFGGSSFSQLGAASPSVPAPLPSAASKPQWDGKPKDVWAAVLFVAHVVVVALAAGKLGMRS